MTVCNVTGLFDSLLPVSRCELVLVVIHALRASVRVNPRPLYSVSSRLSVSVEVSPSGSTLAKNLVAQATKFFNLVITSVTGIPMKVS